MTSKQPSTKLNPVLMDESADYFEEQKRTESTNEKEKFYQEELKKRDEVVMFLCNKMQGMESQIDLLRNQFNVSNQGPSPVNKSVDGSKDYMKYVGSILGPAESR